MHIASTMGETHVGAFRQLGVGIGQAKPSFERSEPSLSKVWTKLWDLSLAYSLSKAFILAQPDLFKSLIWPDSLFKSLLHSKYLIFLWME